MSEPPRLLLLHGFSGSGESWREVIAELPDEWSVSAPDLLGHATASAVAGRSFEDEVERLAAGLGCESGRRCHLVGYSLGARLALGLLASRPERFESATLIGVNDGLRAPAERRARRERDEGWATLLEQDGLEAFIERWQAQPLFASQKELEPALLENQRRIRAAHCAEGLARAMRALGLGVMPDYRERLRSFQRPVRLVVGGLDLKFQKIATEICRDRKSVV